MHITLCYASSRRHVVLWPFAFFTQIAGTNELLKESFLLVVISNWLFFIYIFGGKMISFKTLIFLKKRLTKINDLVILSKKLERGEGMLSFGKLVPTFGVTR